MTDSAAPGLSAGTISARIDRLPATRTIWTIVALLGFGMFFELYDLLFSAYVAPSLVKSGVLTASTAGLFGTTGEARQQAAAALGLSTGRDVQYQAALALASAQDATRAQPLADDLGKRLPEDTIVQFNYLPTTRAQIDLIHNDFARAVEALQPAAPYELGSPHGVILLALYPVYVRGEAYLAAHQGSEAAAEFQKILDHRGVVINQPIGVLAHLQIGRAYAMQGDTAKARAAYQDFLTLWKDADPDIPVLIAAKSEYAKLK